MVVYSKLALGWQSLLRVNIRMTTSHFNIFNFQILIMLKL